eukprot:CAMPEP_0205808074 /NCGR_PEP_ID=MMETSP0205-20121125/11942_1 /ASSEMBLY_ACC=CAM_ASM_000278 /TAXON_ID=36767 /ORGANISM="Euplotes focardii, Strain TN1" /LENGTH=160 /DNA_ID=CAMNT_0053083217 /DNA_START=124 /DNA_END=605 /DNA_ORIENTATION=+
MVLTNENYPVVLASPTPDVKECFKKLKYTCDFCLENWGVKAKDADELICPDLDFGTPQAVETITIRIRNERKKTTDFIINKSKSFRVLMAMIKFGIYERKADLDDLSPDVIARAFKKAKKTPSVKFMQGDTMILDDAKISSLGNNVIIDQKVKYDGGMRI